MPRPAEPRRPPAAEDAEAGGLKAPARGDKGFNSWLMLMVPLINTDLWGGALLREQSFPAHSLSFSAPRLTVSVISFSCTLCFPSYSLFPSVSVAPSQPNTFFILSCVSLDQTGKALHALTFYLFHICNCQKEDCYFRSCRCFVVISESQIEEAVLKTS